MPKIYVTKYALTQGIKEHEADISDSAIGLCAHVKGQFSGYYNNDFWLTKEEAIKHARVMQARKVASLEKQIKKVKSLNFD